jgi:hypothetical protein
VCQHRVTDDWCQLDRLDDKTKSVVTILDSIVQKRNIIAIHFTDTEIKFYRMSQHLSHAHTFPPSYKLSVG